MIKMKEYKAMNKEERDKFFDDLDDFTNDLAYRLNEQVELLELMQSAQEYKSTVVQRLVANAKIIEELVMKEFDYQYELF
jgi:hypothetical protein